MRSKILKILGLFPAQSSKDLPLLKRLAETAPETSHDLLEKARLAIGFSLNVMSLSDSACNHAINQFIYPGTFTASIICFELFKDKKKRSPDVVAGYSLGELAALVAAEALSFEDAIRLVHCLGKWADQATLDRTFRVVTVYGMDRFELNALIRDRIGAGVVEIAGVLAPSEIVVAGDEAGVFELVSRLEGVIIREHPDSAPLHTSFLKEYAADLARELLGIRISPPRFPVLCNVSAKPLLRSEDIKLALIQQLNSPVMWFEAMRYAHSHFRISHALQFGASDFLLEICGKIDPSVAMASIDSSEAVESLVV